MRIGRQTVRRFIRETLRKRIIADLRQKAIASEADLHSCVYLHTRRFLRKDSQWTVLNKAFIRGMSIFPDILLKRRGIPRIAIELKEKRSMNRGWFKADMKKLQSLWSRGKKPIIGFFVCLVRDRRPEQVLQRLAESEWRTPIQRKHLFPVVINAREHVEEWNSFKQWWRRHAKTELGA